MDQVVWALGYVAHNLEQPVEVVVADTRDHVASVELYGRAAISRGQTGLASTRRPTRAATQRVCLELARELEAVTRRAERSQLFDELQE